MFVPLHSMTATTAYHRACNIFIQKPHSPTAPISDHRVPATMVRCPSSISPSLPCTSDRRCLSRHMAKLVFVHVGNSVGDGSVKHSKFNVTVAAYRIPWSMARIRDR